MKNVQKKKSVPLCLCASLAELGQAVPSFTLIELMIVMVVISIMVGITIPISKYVTRRAREANQRIYIEKIKSALEDYRAAYGEYPITPRTNLITGLVENSDDVARHYPANYLTKCFHTTNSAFTNVSLTTDTVEIMETVDYIFKVDYCLTYPLMLKQLESGARPFMEFKEVTVAYIIYNPKEYDVSLGGDTYDRERKRKTALGYKPIFTRGIYGKPVNRPEAIDPVTMKQWWYTSVDGITYNLTNHPDF